MCVWIVVMHRNQLLIFFPRLQQDLPIKKYCVDFVTLSGAGFSC
jgi:hypothetical protein